MEIGPLSAPYLMAPILAMAQLVNVSRPGQQPDPTKPIPEDMRLFGDDMKGPEGGAAYNEILATGSLILAHAHHFAATMN